MQDTHTQIMSSCKTLQFRKTCLLSLVGSHDLLKDMSSCLKMHFYYFYFLCFILLKTCLFPRHVLNMAPRHDFYSVGVGVWGVGACVCMWQWLPEMQSIINYFWVWVCVCVCILCNTIFHIARTYSQASMARCIATPLFYLHHTSLDSFTLWPVLNELYKRLLLFCLLVFSVIYFSWMIILSPRTNKSKTKQKTNK